MARPRKLHISKIEHAAIDRRKGMTWKSLSLKYNVAINTIRKALSDYSIEFAPLNRVKRSELEERLANTERK